jgi:hypothetical protein
VASRWSLTRNRLLRRTFEAAQHLGLDVLPRHFYSAIPDIRELRRHEAWRAPRTMVGLEGADVDRQVAFLAECCTPELCDHVSRHPIYADACAQNGAIGYGPIEAEFLFCFIAVQRPGRVVQVGAGVSTAVILAAADWVPYKIEVCCVDPFPTPYLRRLAKLGRIELIAAPAQEVDLHVFTGVGDRGLLFVDSTHTVKAGSEVNRIVLEAMPRLPAGSWAHFHDIFMPYDYQRDLLSSALFFWSESTLLHAFLVGNRRCALRLALSMLHYERQEDLRRFLSNYQPATDQHGLQGGEDGHFPSSAYLSVLT